MSAALALDDLTEKQEMRLADKAARMMGFRVVNFSQPRASKQTPGIPDRLYGRADRRSVFWYESKSVKGKTSAAQKDMHAFLRASGHVVVVGVAQVAIDEMLRILKTVSHSAPPEQAR
jgi:hypothetical protein